MQSVIILINQIINLYIWIIIAGAILSWLIAFNVINLHNQFVYTIARTLDALTEPVLRPIRNILPDLGGIDVSPIVLILGLIFVQNLLREYFGAGIMYMG